MNVAVKKGTSHVPPPPPPVTPQSGHLSGSGNTVTVTIDSVRAAARNVSGTIERAAQQLSREAAAAVEKAAK